MMKKFSILFLCVAAIFSCEEDEVRPLVSDNGVAPSKVQDVQVVNTAGGARFTYSLPNDQDLLYVEAQFKRQDNAQEVSTVRSSLYNNTLEVTGFGEEKDFEVSLFAVDQSENRSEPVIVTISPEKSPIQYVGESLETQADFGGMYMEWDNPFETNVVFEISVINEFGAPEVVDILYSAASDGSYAVRGFDAVETTFVITIKDRYGNVLAPKRYVITPLFEEAVDKIHHSALFQTHDTPPFNSRWALPLIYNGNTGNVRNAYKAADAWVDPDGELPEYEGLNANIITLDIGVQIKLSRFWVHIPSFWNPSPRYFDVWGSNHLNPDGSLDGWVKIVDNGEIIKPSGLPLGEETAEDNDAIARGFDIIVNSSAPPVRYFRFINRQSFDGTTQLYINEIEFFGKIID